MDNRPIGMFDSGIGGLTVLKEYIKKMPNEDYVYYADTKHLPYGSKTKEEIISYADEITAFLVSQNVKAIIIACGTASSLAYEYIKNKYSIPILDIITPVIPNITYSKVGVIATQGSINSGIWENKIKEHHPNTVLYSQACPKLVPLAEKNKCQNLEAKSAIHQYLKQIKKKDIEALILGCTHYPLFSPFIQQELGKNIPLINIGTASANHFENYLKQNDIGNDSFHQGKISYFCSGNLQDFLEKKEKLFHELSN